MVGIKEKSHSLCLLPFICFKMSVSFERQIEGGHGLYLPPTDSLLKFPQQLDLGQANIKGQEIRNLGSEISEISAFIDYIIYAEYQLRLFVINCSLGLDLICHFI